MSKSKAHDHSPDETLPDPPPIVEPVGDTDINDPPEPAKVKNPELAHVHAIATDIVTLIERIAALIPAGHSLLTPIVDIKQSLGTLWAMAHHAK